MPRFSCNGCTKRHINCHSKCEKYASEKAKNDMMREKEHINNKCLYGTTRTNGTFSGGCYR